MTRTMWAVFLAMVVRCDSMSALQTSDEDVTVPDLCYSYPYADAASTPTAFCFGCSTLAESTFTFSQSSLTINGTTNGNFTCEDVPGSWGQTVCLPEPYEPRSCVQAANLTVLEPTCSNGGSMDPCAYNLTMAMMTSGTNQQYVYFGRYNFTCPRVQGYKTPSQNEATYWLGKNSSDVYTMRNVDGQLKLDYSDCQAEVVVLSGSFLDVSAHGTDNSATSLRNMVASLPLSLVLLFLLYVHHF
eukprot:scaffold544_cov320-Pavlova_lutheri.AAC.41